MGIPNVVLTRDGIFRDLEILYGLENWTQNHDGLGKWVGFGLGMGFDGSCRSLTIVPSENPSFLNQLRFYLVTKSPSLDCYGEASLQTGILMY
jgi:hypothetical protein